MPLPLSLTESIIPAGTKLQAVARITDSMLNWHGLNSHKVMTNEEPGRQFHRVYGLCHCDPLDDTPGSWFGKGE